MYLDTSVAIAIYTREPDSDKLETLLRRGDGFISSELLIGEMSRALLAKEKSRVITPALRKIIVKKLDDHLAAGLVHLVALNSLVIREAVEVMNQVYPNVLLRTLDAIHLATYLGIDAGPFFTKDKRMQDAARLLNIPLVE
jgi:predicted nucleic acid-binding protein|uniref:type II toxin-antitoxin system VapC family toxin n=1 Tax=Cephaloticoccus sp. TaxID=1985742 RepID=UPI00404B2974